MDLKQLRYFDAVAETCHFGQAAERLHLAQPALSQAIRRLEAELGVLLLARTTRQVALTPAGEFFHREVRRILGDLDASVLGARSIAEGSRGLLRVGFTGTSAFTQLARLSRMIRAALPGVVLEVQADLLTPAQVERLLDGRLDLGVLRGPVAEPGIETRTLLQEPLVLALPADHRLVPEPALEVVDVSADEFVAYADTRSAVNEAMLSSCRRAGFSPNITHRAPGTAALLALVAAHLGVALVPESVRSMQLKGVVFRDVAGAASIDLSLAWRAGEPSALVTGALDVLDRDGFFSPHPSPTS
ncbi:LysR substrate-binding domain-containing protein [Pimelobacter simplex]|uniref:LysR substrate-binding domain-containing protein n=1 Tax=Nocardioides simplex TaxID=2045 RepID=UPI00214FCFE0|nr:LysR substrate-binding domain-containing protein [Pimelobacter simplex]UUW92093.1 LysR substrate-binding domain-containing protein [Pimelobacter simplex]UUW95920.1 LysR substrate-binding domain-containing protein [Pimelobacter simplex]